MRPFPSNSPYCGFVLLSDLVSFCRDVKYHEPEFWKFGEEGNKYFRHATGQIYAISKDLATYISINQYEYSFMQHNTKLGVNLDHTTWTSSDRFNKK